jgi:alpha-tubulin suppressor-like RCC1 family protein
VVAITMLVAACGRIDFDPNGAGGDAAPPTGRWVSVQADSTHTCAIRDDAATWCWGANTFSDLGTGAAPALWAAPAQLPGTWRQISSYYSASCGIAADGTLWCWGYGLDGEIGDGMFNNRASPVQIDTSTGWVDISAGADHVCAIDSSNRLWCWGGDGYHEFDASGVGTATKRQLTGTFKAVSASDYKTCVVGTDGVLSCIGVDGYGELGQGTGGYTVASMSPVGSDTDWATVGAGYYHSCAIKTGGSLWCWGANFFGALGVGDTMSHLLPTRVGTDSDWARLEVGYDHTCAQKTDGTLWCWGSTTKGQFGGARTADALSPVSLGHVRSFTVGSGHTCYVDDRGALWCSGQNDDGQAGFPGSISATPVMTDGNWSQLFGYRYHLCGIDTTGNMSCWGDGHYGQLGDGAMRDRQAPVAVPGGPWQTAGLAGDWTLAISGGQLYSWGLGRSSPFMYAPGTWSTVTGGDIHACGIESGGTYCFGGNNHGQLGTGDTNDRNVPTSVTGSFSGLAAGQFFTCGWNTTDVACTGDNYNGEIGNGGLTDTSTFTNLVARGQPAAANKVSSGDIFACALYPDGELWCWGGNGAGELGNGTTADSTLAVRATSTTDWADVGAGDVHVCGVKQNGTLWCWGHGDEGQLGIGSYPATSSMPTQVGTDTNWKSVVGLHHSTCALKTDGTRWCWGANYSGEYGNNSSWLDDFALVTIPGS